MDEVVLSVVVKFAEYLVRPTLQQLKYCFCVGKIKRDFENRKKELMLKQGRVRMIWKKDVEHLIADANNLEEDLKANNGYHPGWRHPWRRYCLYKKLAKTTKRMIDINTKGNCFYELPDIEYHSIQNFRLFNATKIAFDQLWKALEDDGSFMIGLWAMGGAGKTTLVKAVGNKAKESQLFDRVVLAEISKSPDIKKIQGQIADTLEIKFKQESIIGRAKEIAQQLESEEQILIILDDVWATLNLEDIGIKNYQRSCKVVLTTRLLDVCTQMNCQKKIQLDLLKEDEAWTLFQTHANVGDAAKEVVARAIAMECKGLPIAIVAVGTCLKGKGIHEMREMLYRLNNAKPINVDKGVRSAFACLEVSYDYLGTDEARKLLLICAMFPEDHNIDMEDLFRYGMGLGLCRDVDSFEIARSIFETAVNHLIESSLLMDNSSKSNVLEQTYVRLHDMVRDVALWIASKEHRIIMVNCTKELDKLIVDEAINDCYAFSSWYDNSRLLQFPSQFQAPKLEFLLLCSNKLLDISHATFEGTKVLKALIIMCTEWWSRSKIELQPQSIQHLFNLRTLRLQNWNLRDISFVVSLTRLEILDLQKSEFARVPDGIEKLNKLKLLDLSKCRIDECCYKVIGRCSQLEELYVSQHFSHQKNTNCYECLGGFTSNLLKFKRYNLEIGKLDSRVFSFQNEGTKNVRLGQLNISLLGDVLKDLARRATIIEFCELEGGSKSFMDDIVKAVGGMNELTTLCLRRCLKIEYIIDETTPHEDALVPRLDELVLQDMDFLEQLWCGPSPFSLFQKLKRLNISNCPQLLNIFPADNCNLDNLKSLTISSCPMLTSLFPVSTACTLLSLMELQIEDTPQLLNIFPVANCNLGNLKSLTISGCAMLTSLFPVSAACTLLSLMKLRIEDAPQMKFVFGENASEEQLMHDQDENQIELRLLKYLKLKDLPNLVGICSGRSIPRWPSLKAIYWTNCPNMKLQQLEYHQLGNEEYKSLALIERIELANCGIESIFHYQIGLKEQIPAFQCLQELTLEKCARLKFVFSAHICRNLPVLTYVTISCCEKMEAIFSGNEETLTNLCIPESCMLKLKSLKIFKCNKLKFVLPFMIGAATSMLPQLCTLTVSDCSQMEEIFKRSNIEDHDTDSEREIKFPNMRHMVLYNLPMLVNICQGFKLNIGGFKLNTGGFKLRIGESCRVEVHGCPKLMPIRSVRVYCTEEGLVREYELKYSQLTNKEAVNLPLSLLNVGELEIQSPRVEHHYWRIIGDNDQEETDVSEILRSKQQMVGGVIPTQLLSFQFLCSLKVIGSKKLKFLFSMSTIVQNSLPKLTSLTLSACEELEVIFGHSGDDDANYSDTIVLSSLKMIELKKLPKFKSVCLVGLQIQVRLTNINICNCPKFADSSLGSALQLGTLSKLQQLEYHQLGNEEYKSLALIERIELANCGVESIFHYQIGLKEQIPAFQCLQELTLEKCARLKFVFSAHICRNLPVLTYVTISCCEKLEAIFSGNEETLTNLCIPESCMVKLKSLKIFKCNKLKFVLPFMIGAATSMLPQLCTLAVSNCSQMEEIFKRSNIEDHDTDSEREIKFLNMRHMELSNLPMLVNICQGFKLNEGGFRLHTGESYRVKVHGCPKLIPIRSAIVSCTIEGLVREYELKYSQLNNKEVVNLPLSVLNVGELEIQSPRVEHHNWRIIGDDDQEETDDFEILRSEQEMLGGVVPTQLLSFQYLHSLEVTGSKKLKFLFSMSTIVQHSLPKLTSLTLSDCEEMEVIFGHSGDDDANYGDTNLLSSLKKIELKNLPNFKSVCLVGLQIQVELTDIDICNCPKFVDSSLGSALQQLGTLSVSTEDPNVETSSNVNEEKGTMLISRAEDLRLEDSMNLIFVWEGPTFIKFENLAELYVNKCRRLKCIFSSTVMRSLPCLGRLWIEECEELEEIMASREEEHNHFPNESSNNSFCFPQLRTLIVSRCRKLKWLFPSLPFTQHLPQLQYLWIEECEELEEIMSSGEEEHNHFPNESSNNSFCFPQLQRLAVKRCRKLKWLFPSLPSTRRLPKLYRLTIKECCQLKGLCNSEVEIHEEGFYDNSLPKLEFLTVEDCLIFSETTLAALKSCKRRNGLPYY